MLIIAAVLALPFDAAVSVRQRPGAVPPAVASVPVPIVANRNLVPAGHLQGGVLSVRLAARDGVWYPDEHESPGMTVQAFAQEGHAPSIPGPLIRVREGTRIRVSVRNAIPGSTLVMHGLHGRPAAADDTVQVTPGAVRVVEFDAGTPGTYFYWATTTTPSPSFEDRWGADSQLSGALVVDPAAGPAGDDHLLVITGTFIEADTTSSSRRPERFQLAINGRSWPHTERFGFPAGDTVRWRWINASGEAHPMHLHGFYFRVDRVGSEGVDTAYVPALRPLVVTQRMELASSMTITWVPERAGNWLMHCHIQAHVEPGMRFPFADTTVHRRHRNGNHALDAMAGLAIGISVRPGPGRRAVPSEETAGRRELRLVASPIPDGRRNKAYGFLLEDGRAPAASGAPSAPGPTIALVRGEPARITVVNRLAEPTAVHWHGLELDSYSDGVAGWSGRPGRVAPLIAPGDSFQAYMTPPRSGTFIYHSHMEEGHQRGDGLYGALIVVEPGRMFDPASDLLFVAGGREPEDSLPPMLNGAAAPRPMELVAGRRYRLRLINIMENNGLWFTLRDTSGVVTWRPVAKDGADLPAAQATERVARQRIVVGETYDFEFGPAGRSVLRLEAGRADQVLVTQLLRVR